MIEGVPSPSPLHFHAQSRESRLIDQGGTHRWHAEINAQVTIHGARLSQNSGLPSRDCLHGHAELFGKLPLAKSKLFAIESDLLRREQPDAFPKSCGDLFIGVVIED